MGNTGIFCADCTVTPVSIVGNDSPVVQSAIDAMKLAFEHNRIAQIQAIIWKG